MSSPILDLFLGLGALAFSILCGLGTLAAGLGVLYRGVKVVLLDKSSKINHLENIKVVPEDYFESEEEKEDHNDMVWVPSHMRKTNAGLKTVNEYWRKKV